MKALPLEQKQLLALQKADLAIARIEHEERSHPALVTLATLKDRQADLRRAIVASQADLESLERQIEMAEGEISKVRARRALQQSRLDDGKVLFRDMSAMEHEIASIDQRIDRLEDEILELMEKAEKLQSGIAAAEVNAAAIGEDEAKATAEVGDDLVVSQAKKAEIESERASIRVSLPDDVVALYDRLRSRLGTLVVVEVRDGNVLGSPVEFSFAELSDLGASPVDELFVSDETELIVVRTSAN